MSQETALSRASREKRHGERLRQWHARFLLACLATAIAGCAGVPSSIEEEPDQAIPEAEPAPEPTAPIPEPAETPPPPEPEPPLPDTPKSFDAKAAIMLSGRSPAFEHVAQGLVRLLDQPLVYDLSDKSQSPEDAFAGVAESDVAIVIAIGYTAAEAAVTLSTVPVVYCQVFNFKAGEGGQVPVKGIAAIPPLSLQIEEWLKADPGLQRIGAILGDGHQTLIAEAKDATKRSGLAFHFQVAASDRETLYLFKRMAPDIDGFWLFPDNRILSIPVLRTMVDIADRHGVRIAVFNEALLELGVSVSTAADESDIAETAVSVAQQVLQGKGDAVPDLTPLHKLNLRETRSGEASPGLAIGRYGTGPKGRL